MFVPIQKLEPGMRVARDVASQSGAILLSKGTVLTTHLLTALHRFGLPGAPIVQDTFGAAAPLSPEIRQAAERHVLARFQFLSTDCPNYGTLRDLAERRAAARMAETTLWESDRKL